MSKSRGRRHERTGAKMTFGSAKWAQRLSNKRERRAAKKAVDARTKDASDVL